MTADNKARKQEGDLTLEPIDYWHLFDDFVRWMRPSLTQADARDLVNRFLTTRVRPGFNPVRERVHIDGCCEKRKNNGLRFCESEITASDRVFNNEIGLTLMSLS